MMKLSYHPIICLPCLLFLLIMTRVLQPSYPPESSRAPYQISVGYWNDNLIFQDFLQKIVDVGPDDFITSCFWSQLACSKNRHWIIFDTYYHVLTNKSEHYRFDLIDLRLSVEKETPGTLLQLGAGLTARGNFGGATIQNRYHNTFGCSALNLPYISGGAVGLSMFTKIEPHLINQSTRTLHLSFTHTHRTAAGPSQLRAGLNGCRHFARITSFLSLTVQGHAGYFRYYNRDRFNAPMFSGGFGYALMATGLYKERYGLALWLTENQYGGHNPHYGISFSLNQNQARLLRISDIFTP